MDQRLLQRTRYLLQTRFQRMRSAKRGNFEIICQQVITWLENHPILNSSIEYLDSIRGEHHEEIQMMLNADRVNGSRYYYLTVEGTPRQDSEPEFRGYTPKTFDEHASACLQVIRAAIQKPNLEFYCLLAVYLTQEDYDSVIGNLHETVQVIKDTAIHDLYEYLDERIDSINAINGLLQKYKQNAEWFQRHQLRQITEAGYEGEGGERALALHLQQYVFNQGVEFAVEPSSVSGKVDLLLRDTSGQYTIIDAKYVSPDTSSSAIIRKIAEGLNQVTRYCEDYNQPEGFLVVFINDDKSLLIELDQNDGFKYFKIGGNIIYYIEINIADRPSASKAGKAKQISITRDQLIQEIEVIGNEASK